MSGARASSSRMRWLMLFMAFLATAINYVDRANLAVAIPYVQGEYGLSPAASGALLGALSYLFVVGEIAPLPALPNSSGSRVSAKPVA